VRNTSNDLTFDSVEPPMDISIPWISSVSSPVTKKKAASTVSIEIHKGAIFDRLKIILYFVRHCQNLRIFSYVNGF
jgi:hypothetical protein